MALKELLKQRVMEKLNFSQEISDEHLKGVIQEEIMKISEEYPLLLSDKIRLNQEVFYALRRLDILQDLLEDDSVTEIMINGYKNIFIERQGKLHRYPGHFSDNEKLYQVALTKNNIPLPNLNYFCSLRIAQRTFSLLKYSLAMRV